MRRLRLGVLVSGRGTNLQSIIDAIERGDLAADIAIVISNRKDALALRRARDHGIEAIYMSPRHYPSREAYDDALKAELEGRNVGLVVLAGYMLVLSPGFVRHFYGRLVNIHPALLPSFPGTHAQAQALARGVKISGCTVHFVDEGVDTGPIILQAAVPVLEDDTEEILSARILEQEHILYPRAIQLFAEGRLVIEGGRVRILPGPVSGNGSGIAEFGL
ncbi:MAG: phosphoribosylglycinamide formyltransferase [Firmicutes bacterium]|nr:phosphoribosylglycinamide formyltransferase [Bacillota bacterium]